MNPTLIVAYLVLFATVGFLFIFGALLMGWFLRGRVPTPEKREIYECGEPPVGTGFIQFDLRFYVVALLFLVLDVEVAFFFPWATVFGKATQVADPRLPVVTAASGKSGRVELSAPVAARFEEMGVTEPRPPQPAAGVEWNTGVIRRSARRLALMAAMDIAVFFGVVLVGFAYLWYRGDLDWVRAVRPRPAESEVSAPEEPVALRA